MIFDLKKYINNLFATELFKKHLFNTGWIMFENVFRSVVSFVISIYVIRYLSTEEFGLLSFAVSFVCLFVPFVKLGLDDILVREVVRFGHLKDYFLGTVFGIRMIGGILLLGLSSLIISVTDSNRLLLFMVVIIALGYVVDTLGVIELYFQSQVRSKFTSIAKITASITVSLLKILLIFCHASLIWFALALTVEVIVRTIVLCICYYRLGFKIAEWKFKLSLAKKMLKTSFPLMLSGLAAGIYLRIDQVMIKYFLGNSELAYYAVAVRLTEAFYFIPLAIGQSLFPEIIKAVKTLSHDIYIKLRKIYMLLIWGTLCIIIPIFLLAPYITVFLYGKAYYNSGTPLSIYVWSSLFIAIGAVSNGFLVIQKLQIIALINILSGAMINIVLNIILIPRYGITGACFATIISYAFSNYLALAMYKKTRESFRCILSSFNFFKLISAIYSHRYTDNN